MSALVSLGLNLPTCYRRSWTKQRPTEEDFSNQTSTYMLADKSRLIRPITKGWLPAAGNEDLPIQDRLSHQQGNAGLAHVWPVRTSGPPKMAWGSTEDFSTRQGTQQSQSNMGAAVWKRVLKLPQNHTENAWPCGRPLPPLQQEEPTISPSITLVITSKAPDLRLGLPVCKMRGP